MKAQTLALTLALALSFGLTAGAFAQTTNSTPAPAASAAKTVHKDKVVKHKADAKTGTSAKAGSPEAAKK